MKAFFISIACFVVLIVGFLMWSSFREPAANNLSPDVVSATGLHWHPKLEMYVRGEKQEIPHNLGLGVVHQPIHTHEDLPIIHLEFQRPVRKQDITLGQFFKTWGRDFNSFGSTVKMTVNGEENTELENYQMKDGDNIVLRYE